MNSHLQVHGFFSLHFIAVCAYSLDNSPIFCYSVIRINYHLIPPLLLIDPHYPYSPNNFTLVNLGFRNLELLQIPKAFHCLYNCLQICNLSDRQI